LWTNFVLIAVEVGREWTFLITVGSSVLKWIKVSWWGMGVVFLNLSPKRARHKYELNRSIFFMNNFINKFYKNCLKIINLFDVIQNSTVTKKLNSNNNVFMISNYDWERRTQMTTLWIVHLNKLCICLISIINLIESLTL